MKLFKIAAFVCSFLTAFIVGSGAAAQETFLSRECGIKLIAEKKILDKISVRKVDGLLVDSFFPTEKHLRRLSKVCEIALSDETEYNEYEIMVEFEYPQTAFRPRIHVWDTARQTWTARESIMNRQAKTVGTALPFRHYFFAAFADEREKYMGIASWYRHARYPLGSATNLFPIGTKLRVTNSDTEKSVLVTVTSTWTNKDNNRIIDLVRTAFEKIGNPRQGLIPVTIERVTAS